jgi:hypothetical protein
MAVALLHHCFKNNIKVVGMTLNPGGTGLADSAITEVGKEYGRNIRRITSSWDIRPV